MQMPFPAPAVPHEEPVALLAEFALRGESLFSLGPVFLKGTSLCSASPVALGPLPTAGAFLQLCWGVEDCRGPQSVTPSVPGALQTAQA